MTLFHQSSPASLEMPFSIDDIYLPSTPEHELLPALVDHRTSPAPLEAVSAPSTPKCDSVPTDTIVEQLWATVLDTFSPPRSPESSASVIADPAALWATVLDTFSPPRSPESSASVIADPTALWATVPDNFPPPTSQRVPSRGLPHVTSPTFISNYSDSTPTPAARRSSAWTRQGTTQSAGLSPTGSPPPAMDADWTSILEQSPGKLSLPGLGAPSFVGESGEPEGAMEGVEAVGPPPPPPRGTPAARIARVAGRVVLPITQLSPPHWGAYNEMLTIRASQLFHVDPHVVFQ